MAKINISESIPVIETPTEIEFMGIEDVIKVNDKGKKELKGFRVALGEYTPIYIHYFKPKDNGDNRQIENLGRQLGFEGKGIDTDSFNEKKGTKVTIVTKSNGDFTNVYFVNAKAVAAANDDCPF